MYRHSTRTRKLAAFILLCSFAALLVANSSAVNFVATGNGLEEPTIKDLPTNGKRIINGRPIKISEAPYYVQISDKHRKLFCGGTIISESFVVTAAHCLTDKLVKHIRVTANTNIINDGGMQRKVAGIRIHPKYDPETLNADVAVLKLKTPFKLQRRQAVRVGLCLANVKDDYDITVSGWGAISESGALPESLQAINVKALSYESCSKVMNITKTMICSRVVDNKDACQGDSGGPAIYQGRLCGIVSWGEGCGHNGLPGVYTNVVKVRGFINSILNGTVVIEES